MICFPTSFWQKKTQKERPVDVLACALPVRRRFPCSPRAAAAWGVPGAQHLCNPDEQTGQPWEENLSG